MEEERVKKRITVNEREGETKNFLSFGSRSCNRSQKKFSSSFNERVTNMKKKRGKRNERKRKKRNEKES